jgi:hypothetical protein
MRCKPPSILSLTLLGTVLGGASAPPPDCPQASIPGGQTYPMAVDLSGQAGAATGLSSATFAALPSLEGTSPCRSPLPVSPQQTSTLQSESADVIHGLPLPDILRPITDPQPHPELR